MTLATSTSELIGRERSSLSPSMVERITLILDAFVGATTRLTYEEVARRAQLPRSTTYRILAQLVGLRWLDHDALGYRLGPRALGLGGRGNDHGEIRASAASALNDLHVRTGAVVHLGVLEGPVVHYLDKVGGAAAASVPSRVGARVPAHQTALGRAMLAFLQPERVDALLADTQHRGVVSVTPELENLHQELHRVRRRRGLAFEDGSQDPIAMGSVAAVVHGPDGQMGAIAVVRRGDTSLERVAPLVVDAARRTSQALLGNCGSYDEAWATSA